jgi:hypothetical protein
MSTASHWLPGDPVVLRGVWRGRIWWAAAVTVVRDDLDLIALYWRPGTPQKQPLRRLTPLDLVSTEPPPLLDRAWVDREVLALAVPGAAHSVYGMWEDGHARLVCWYIDLQQPLRRTPLGFDCRDHLLDIVVSPDRSEWRWKDEDEFSEGVCLGVFSAQEERAIRAEGNRAVRELLAGRPPFSAAWEKWTPPAHWEIPQLPADWDRM